MNTRGRGKGQRDVRNDRQAVEGPIRQVQINQSETTAAAPGTAAVENTAEADESAVCWICAEPVKYYSVSECNHRTCHVCALRLRALYKKLECTFCKVSIRCILVSSTARHKSSL